MDRTTRETRRQSYDAVLPKREKRCRLILETLGAREMTASEITEELVAAGEIPYFNRNYVAPRLTEMKQMGILKTVGRRKERNKMNENRDSIMRMARGAFEERVDYEMDKVIQNILDPNTKATAKRKITLTIELTPDDERRQIQVSVTAKSTLAATNPVATSLYVTGDGNGELVVAEMVPQVPGQLNMDGTQQEQPKLLKLVTHA